MPRKHCLAHLPTPLWRSDALDALVGAEVWVKRDDMTAGAEAGNKIRKLEYLLRDAVEAGATAVITCGGVQSNHARATALLAASLGLGSMLLLRAADPAAPQPPVGNLLLDRLAGADVRFISAREYARRDALMHEMVQQLARSGRRAYAIPEGGSNGLGALGYVDAMHEVREQLDLGLGGSSEPFDAIVHACGSGGTSAGVALGAARFAVARRVHAIAVCDDRATFEVRIAGIIAEARRLQPELGDPAECVVHDAFKGPAYAVASDEQRRFIVDVARRTGLVLDPVYSGKALFGLARLDPKPRRALFIHTGGLPGLLAQADAFAEVTA
jgi:D-cysteine desulfhydrase